MINIRFYVSNNNRIIRCNLTEIKGLNSRQISHEISLDQETLKKLLSYYKHNYAKTKKSSKSGSYTLYSFSRIKKEEMDYIISESDKYGKRNSKFKSTPKRRVKRENRFKGTVTTIVSTSLATILGAVGINAIVNDSKIEDNEPDQVEIASVTPVEPVTNNAEEENTINSTIVDTSIEDETYDATLPLNCDDWRNTEKYKYAKENYYEIIESLAKTYGLDPQLVLAIACHERGYHSEEVDKGGGLGLFQIQMRGSWNWEGKEIKAFNYDTNEYETYVVTEENVKNLYDNIKVGCMVIQDALRRNKYNVPKAVTEYNIGYSNVKSIIETTSAESNQEPSYFNDSEHLEWLNYRNTCKVGDPNYLENVFKYIEPGTVLVFQTVDGREISVKYVNLNLEEENNMTI